MKNTIPKKIKTIQSSFQDKTNIFKYYKFCNL